MGSLIQTLPSPSDLSPAVLSFLSHNLTTAGALAGAPVIVSELQSQRAELDRSVVDLNRRLASILVAYASFSSRTHSLLAGLKLQLAALGSSTFQGMDSSFVCYNQFLEYFRDFFLFFFGI